MSGEPSAGNGVNYGSDKAPPYYRTSAQYPPPSYLPYPRQTGPSVPSGATQPTPTGGTVTVMPTHATVPTVPCETVTVFVTEPNDFVAVRESYSGHKALACFVFWLCAWVLGGIAWLLAVKAHDMAAAGRDIDGARDMGNWSMGLSVTGVVLGLVVWGIVIWAIWVYWIY